MLLFDVVSPAQRAVLHGHVSSVQGAAFSPDGRRLVSCAGGSENVKFWDIVSGQELLTLAGQGSMLRDVQFSEDGNTLFVGSFYVPGSYQFWRAPSWDKIAAAENGAVKR